MARKALLTESVQVHPLCSKRTWLLMMIPGVLLYWILSPRHKIILM